MHGSGEHLVTIPEDRLRAVAVVRVDVEQRDACRSTIAQVLSRDRCVVEVAGATERGSGHVMSGRAAARVRDRFTAEDEVGSGERDVDSSAGRLPGSLRDYRHRVEAPCAGAR